MIVFFTNLSFLQFLVRYLALFLLFFSNRLLWVVLDEKSSQEYPVNAEVPQGLTGLKKTGTIDVKMDGSVLE